MIELGKKDKLDGMELLTKIEGLLTTRPTEMPNLGLNHKVVCGYDQGMSERMIICDTLEEMQQLFDAYAKGGALHIHWYTGPIIVITGGQAKVAIEG